MKIKIVDRLVSDSTDTENQITKVVGKNVVIDVDDTESSVLLGELKKVVRCGGSTVLHGVGWHLVIEHKQGLHTIEGSL